MTGEPRTVNASDVAPNRGYRVAAQCAIVTAERIILNALTAAQPLIEQQVREQVADEIDAGPGELRSRSWWSEYVRSGPSAPAHVVIEFPTETTGEDIARFKAALGDSGPGPVEYRRGGQVLDV